MEMNKVRTPCIGICSTTSLGDLICRGCKRYSYEVINWNSYGDEEKLAVLSRIEQLNNQIIAARFTIHSSALLQAALKQFKVPYDPSRSPYCWLHNLLKKAHDQLEDVSRYGFLVREDFAT